MEGELVHELEVSAAASEVWDIYGNPKYHKVVCESIPHVVKKIEVEGDGRVGTIINVVLHQVVPGKPAFSFIEKITKLDNQKRVKETDHVSGGFLDIGFSFYRVRHEIIEKKENSCIIKSTIQYKVDTPANAIALSLECLELVAVAVGKRLGNKKN